MQKVFVLDSNKHPLTPCKPARARILLSQGKAAVYRNYLDKAYGIIGSDFEY
ncbi:MAG: RRXRR domain-containing protein [Desulfamplus sp.]|nr:RRXRR domain-containing protein [Desulfamplus sp.]